MAQTSGPGALGATFGCGDRDTVAAPDPRAAFSSIASPTPARTVVRRPGAAQTP